MTEPRAHRPPLAIEYAVEELGRAVRDGKLDRVAVDAVIAAAADRTTPRARRSIVAGLTDRELEVLRLLARGMPDRQIAQRLTVSERTAHHHVEHIYAKLGVSTRAAATVIAMQRDLLGDTLEVDWAMG